LKKNAMPDYIKTYKESKSFKTVVVVSFFIFFLAAQSGFLFAQIPNVPYFYQYHNSINPGGSCQNTSMAMVLKYNGATNETPDAISTVHGTSLAQSVSGFNQVCNSRIQHYGLNASCVSTSSGSFGAMQTLLSQGKPVVIHGYFTSYGHVIVVLSYTGTHYVCHDPAGQWNQQYQGSYSGGATSGQFIYYAKSAFETATGPDNTLWYHYINNNNPPPTVPTNLTATPAACPTSEVSFSWTNSGTGWQIHLADNASYNNTYIKWVSNLTSYTGPSGFVLQSDGTTPLVLSQGQTYYWRIYNGSTYTNGPSFTMPLCDNVPPTTSINIPGAWVTENFTATFTDADNQGGSGIDRRFYQVSAYDGTEWRANAQRGFFTDDFANLSSSVWTVPSGGGTWNAQNNALVQSDLTLTNTNIYAALNQTLSNRLMYHFTAKAEGAQHADGRRFGFHFFSDNGALSNRGNSYFVWFRLDDSKLQFFKATNDVFTMVKEVTNVSIAAGTTYDFKVIYDRIIGDILVYQNNSLIGSYTDPQPFSTNGNYISFRTGNCMLTINEINVYRTRLSTATVTVGAASDRDIRFQNPSPGVNAGRIKSIVSDVANNLSSVALLNLNVDWTPPAAVAYVNDGTMADIDTVILTTSLSANWASTNDIHSGIASYWYAIGTSPGDTNVVNWTANGTNTSVTHNGLSLVYGTNYYFTLKAKNNAGLYCTAVSSDGVVVLDTLVVIAEYLPAIVVYPNPVKDKLYIETDFQRETLVEIFTLTGVAVKTQDIQEHSRNIIDVSDLPQGVYLLRLRGHDSTKMVRFIRLDK